MAYNYKSYWRRYYRRRYKNRSVKAITTTRNFKASSANMTQNGRFNINVRGTVTLNVPNNNTSVFTSLDVANAIKSSPMHAALANVFDQYRIEKMTVRFRPLASANVNLPSTREGASLVVGASAYETFFTAVDRTGFREGQTLDMLRTYSSYKESVWPTNGDTAGPHYVAIGQADVVSRSTYYDSKNKAAFPSIAYGVDVGATNVTGGNLPFSFTYEIDAQVRYRGVRLDTTVSA